MSYSISFETNAFGEGKIPKEWVLSFLRENGIAVGGSTDFDWGCLIFVEYDSARYVVTIMAYEDNGYEDVVIDVDRDRTLLQTMMFRNKVTKADGLLALIYGHAKNMALKNHVRVIHVP